MLPYKPLNHNIQVGNGSAYAMRFNAFLADGVLRLESLFLNFDMRFGELDPSAPPLPVLSVLLDFR